MATMPEVGIFEIPAPLHWLLSVVTAGLCVTTATDWVVSGVDRIAAAK